MAGFEWPPRFGQTCFTVWLQEKEHSRKCAIPSEDSIILATVLSNYPPYMLDLLQVSGIVIKASVPAEFGCFVMILMMGPAIESGVDSPFKAIALVGAALMPIVPAGWWMSRKLRLTNPPGEVRAISRTFVVFTPFSIAIGSLPGLLAGGIVESFGFSRISVGVVAYLAASLFTVVANTVVCLFALWLTRRTDRVLQPKAE
jgi:hypothetical protein